MVEPNQDDFNRHFQSLAQGKVLGDNDIKSLSRQGLGGHHHQKINYKMAYDPTPKDPRPVQNVTSDIASSVNQAKSRLGKAIKLGEEETGVSSASDHSRSNTSSHKRKKTKTNKTKTKGDKVSKHKKSKKDKKSKKKKK